MLQQQLVMEADADKFKIIQEYLKAMPRSTNDELHALDLNLIQRGQQRPIEVRGDMGILDGYTRHDLLGQREIKIKYIFKDFPNEEEELEYVRECNVMRRQLNEFQRVEIMYDKLKHERELRRINQSQSYTDIILSIKYGNDTVNKMASDMHVGKKYTNRMLISMMKEFYVKREKNPEILQGFIYSLMPKSEERLGKIKNAKRMGQLNLLDIGVKEYIIQKSMYLIEHASDELLDKLRSGDMKVYYAYDEVFGKIKKSKKGESKGIVWGKYAKIKCPHCGNVGGKGDYIKV